MQVIYFERFKMGFKGEKKSQHYDVCQWYILATISKEQFILFLSEKFKCKKAPFGN